MGRKSSAKQQSSHDSSSTPPTGKGGMSPVLIGVLIVGVLAIGGFALLGGGNNNAADSTSAAADAAAAKSDEPTPAIVAATEAQAKLGPHKQENLPPIPFAAVRAAASARSRHRGVSFRRRTSRSLQLRAVLLRLPALGSQGQHRLLREVARRQRRRDRMGRARRRVRSLYRRRDALAADARFWCIRPRHPRRGRKGIRTEVPDDDADAQASSARAANQAEAQDEHNH